MSYLGVCLSFCNMLHAICNCLLIGSFISEAEMNCLFLYVHVRCKPQSLVSEEMSRRLYLVITSTNDELFAHHDCTFTEQWNCLGAQNQ